MIYEITIARKLASFVLEDRCQQTPNILRFDMYELHQSLACMEFFESFHSKDAEGLYSLLE